MFFVYQPDEGDRQEWWFDPHKIKTREAEAIEKKTGWDWEEFGTHLIKGSVVARRALLWMFLRRVHPVLKFEDLDFAVSEVTLEYSKEELELIRVETDKSGASEVMLTALDQQIAEARSHPKAVPSSDD